MITMYSLSKGCNKEFEIYSQGKLHEAHQNTSVDVAKTHVTLVTYSRNLSVSF